VTRSVPIAGRNLTGQRARFVMSVGGVGLALLLVLALNAVFAGVTRQVTAYVDHSGADAIVSQRGVTTMHMSNSALPLSTLARARAVREVASVAPILYRSVVLETSKGQAYTYLIGFRTGGGPWGKVDGQRTPPGGGVVLDRRIATRLGVGLDDRITVAGGSVRVAGLMQGTTSIVSSVSFLDFTTFAHAAGATRSASYLLARARPGVSPARLASALQAALPEATVQTRAQFAAAERHTVADMSTSLIRGLTLVGFIIGVAVAGLSLYTSTAVRLREYAVLRAIGLKTRDLYLIVLRQALAIVGLGLIVGLVLLGAVALLVAALAPQVTVLLTAGDLLQAAAITLVIGLFASLFPAQRLAKAEPAAVYRT
jgi:putative ABC transport system permease protein